MRACHPLFHSLFVIFNDHQCSAKNTLNNLTFIFSTPILRECSQQTNITITSCGLAVDSSLVGGVSIPFISVGTDLSDKIFTEPINLNNGISLDFYEQGINIEKNPNIDLVEKKESLYYDEDNFVEYLKGDQNIICLSSNVQSLNGKFNSISIFFDFIEKNAINVDVFALQETWKINTPNTVKLPGFKLFFKDRAVGRGGE